MSSSTPKERADNIGSDSEEEDVFHDARFPAEEEAVSLLCLFVMEQLSCLHMIVNSNS